LEKYWGDQATRGNCTIPDVFLLPNGPGAVTVKGRRQVLEKLATSENLRELLDTGYSLFRDWHYRFVMPAVDWGSWRRWEPIGTSEPTEVRRFPRRQSCPGPGIIPPGRVLGREVAFVGPVTPAAPVPARVL
jgi:hypothetical protein